jgi:O-antigen/teichoic acid export membrane protein
MTNDSIKYIVSGTVWGFSSKIINAGIQFITIPLLIGFYGKEDYGLIALAFSLNAYLGLMGLGLNTGAIRYFSIWFSKNEKQKIIGVSQSSIVFYGIIGILNAIILLFIGNLSNELFQISIKQYYIFRWMMTILAASAIFNWTSSVIIQLLTANEQFAVINKINIVKSILNILAAVLAVLFEYSLPIYFMLFTISNLSIIPLYIFQLKKTDIKIFKLLKPQWDYTAFKEVIVYSLSIFAMGIFQFTANQLRPMLLASFASNGIISVTEFRVIQTIAQLIIVLGGVFLQVLLPISSKEYINNNTRFQHKIVYDGTKYISVILSLIIFIIIMNAKSLLIIYVGKEFSHLSNWLIIWCITILLYLHNSPVASMVLASGKTKPLVYSSATGCAVSIITTIILAPKLNIGGAIFGYLFYIIIQMSFYYLYYIPKILNLNSMKIFFDSFLSPVIAGVITLIITNYIMSYILISSEYLSIIASSFVFLIIYCSISFTIIIKKQDIAALVQKASN